MLPVIAGVRAAEDAHAGGNPQGVLLIDRQVMDSRDEVRHLRRIPVSAAIHGHYNSRVSGRCYHALLRTHGHELALAGNRAALPALSVVGRVKQTIGGGTLPTFPPTQAS